MLDAAPESHSLFPVMRTPFVALLLIFSVLVAGCSKPQTDPVENAFKQKFQSLRLGMNQADVLKKLGEPSRIQAQIEQEDDTIQTESEPIRIRKGDVTKVLVYTFGRNDYTLWFALRNTNDMSTGVLFMQNVISVGNAVRIK